MRKLPVGLALTVGVALASVVIAQVQGPATSDDSMPAFKLSDVQTVAVVDGEQTTRLTGLLQKELAGRRSSVSAAFSLPSGAPVAEATPRLLMEARSRGAQAVLSVSPCVESQRVEEWITYPLSSTNPGDFTLFLIPAHDKIVTCLQAALVETNRGKVLWQMSTPGRGAFAIRRIVRAFPAFPAAPQRSVASAALSLSLSR